MGIDGSSTMNSPIFCSQTSLFSDLRGAEVPAWKINERCWKTAFARASVLTDLWSLSPLLHSYCGFGNYFKLWLVRVWLCQQSSLGVFWYLYIFFVFPPHLCNFTHKKSVDSSVVLLCFALIVVFLLGIGWACTCWLVALPFFHKWSFHFKGRR